MAKNMSKSIALRLEPDEYARLNQFAEMMGWTRSHAVRELLSFVNARFSVEQLQDQLHQIELHRLAQRQKGRLK